MTSKQRILMVKEKRERDKEGGRRRGRRGLILHISNN